MHGLNEAKALSPETLRTFSIRTSPHLQHWEYHRQCSVSTKKYNLHNVYHWYYQDEKQNQYVKPMKILFTFAEKNIFRQNFFLSTDWFLVIFNSLSLLSISILLFACEIQVSLFTFFDLSCIICPFSSAFLFHFPHNPHFVLTFNPISPPPLLEVYSTWSKYLTFDYSVSE